LAQALISSKNTAIDSILVNQAKNSQICRETIECNELYVEYCDVPGNPELLWCRDLGMQDNNRTHGAVIESNELVFWFVQKLTLLQTHL
jgi:hypothetical protein